MVFKIKLYIAVFRPFVLYVLFYMKSFRWFIIDAAVSASDGLLRGFTDVIVHVTDVNDNAPTFSQSACSISLPENAPADDVIMTLTALDDDLGDNALVTYELIG